MNSGKIVAIITGAISVILAVAYLILVQLLDFRGEMLPAPTSQIEPQSWIVAITNLIN
jgi:hypothetical protein